MFELYQLNQFVKVVECKTLSQAAEALNITQPALSRSIKNLEDELNVPLFDREKNKIELNESGKLAYEQTKRLLEQAAEMEKQIQSSDKRLKTITVGSCAPTPFFRGFTTVLTKCFPAATVKTEICKTEQLLEKLKDRTYSLVIMPHPVTDKDVCCVPFLKEKLYAVMDGSQSENKNANQKKGVYFKSLNGKAIMLMPLPGYWNDLVTSKIQNAHFLSQQKIQDYDEVMQNSTLISFTTNFLLEANEMLKNKIVVPILDADAEVEYTCVCLKTDRPLFSEFFTAMQVK